MVDLIPAPDLDIRNEEQLAAEAIARTSGGLSVEIIDSQIEARRKLRDLVEAGALDPPICPELTNANPSSPHTVILEALAWLLGPVGYRINQLPKRDAIEFHRLFKIELREAEPATTILEFAVSPPPDVDVTVPAGTEVSTEDGKIVFETIAELVIPYGSPTGQVAAQNTVLGATLLSPNVLIRQVDAVAWVDSVTNPNAVDSGGDDETIEEALERARSYQRRGERLVSTADIEDAILMDVLRGRGIVKGFPFVMSGAFGAPARVGHSTFVVMTLNGNPVSTADKQAINGILEQRIGAAYIYISDPIYVTCNVIADVRLTASAPQGATLKAIENDLRSFYAADKKNFGRPILRSEIITLIEGTPGVDRIVSSETGPIIGSPVTDVKLSSWELPKLETVILNAV